jgi:uncharacterized protein YndB with AHSA1/START domain
LTKARRIRMLRFVVKKGAIVVAALVLAVVLAVAVIGSLLPAEHVASGQVTLDVPPDRVFQAISEVNRYPVWRSSVSRVEVLATDPLRWREHENGDAITFEVVDNRAPQLMKVRIADPDLPFGGTWTYTLTPAGTGTRLQVTEEGVVHNVLFRFVSRFVIGHTATIDRYLADLEAFVRRS